MFCEECGKDLGEPSKFCSGCGAAIRPSPEPRTDEKVDEAQFDSVAYNRRQDDESTEVALYGAWIPKALSLLLGFQALTTLLATGSLNAWLLDRGLFVIAGTIYLTWIYKATSYVRSFDELATKFDAQMAVILHIVPLVFLWAPYRAVADLCTFAKTAKASPLGWWCLLIFSMALNGSVSRGLVARGAADVLHALAWLAAAWMLYGIVNEVDNGLRTHSSSRRVPVPSTGAPVH